MVPSSGRDHGANGAERDFSLIRRGCGASQFADGIEILHQVPAPAQLVHDVGELPYVHYTALVRHVMKHSHLDISDIYTACDPFPQVPAIRAPNRVLMRAD